MAMMQMLPPAEGAKEDKPVEAADAVPAAAAAAPATDAAKAEETPAAAPVAS